MDDGERGHLLAREQGSENGTRLHRFGGSLKTQNLIWIAAANRLEFATAGVWLLVATRLRMPAITATARMTMIIQRRRFGAPAGCAVFPVVLPTHRVKGRSQESLPQEQFALPEHSRRRNLVVQQKLPAAVGALKLSDRALVSKPYSDPMSIVHHVS